MAHGPHKSFWPAFLRHGIALALISAAAVAICWSLFQNAFLPTHDYQNSLVKHLYMLYFFGQGQVLPVWVPEYHSGYGGAVFNFYPPLFHLLSAGLGTT